MGSPHYYSNLAAAFVRGRLGLPPDTPDEAAVARGLEAELRLYRFKRNAALPRVRRVLGMLQALAPAHLLDVGSGRGTFLWPLLDELPGLRVTAIDGDPQRAADIQAVARGGIERLEGYEMDVTALAFASDSFDGVTVLEVLEHLEHPERAAAEAVRVARRFVLVSVPSKPDNNPEHIQLFTAESLTRLLYDAGAKSVRLDGVRGHFVALALLE